MKAFFALRGESGGVEEGVQARNVIFSVLEVVFFAQIGVNLVEKLSKL